MALPAPELPTIRQPARQTRRDHDLSNVPAADEELCKGSPFLILTSPVHEEATAVQYFDQPIGRSSSKFGLCATAAKRAACAGNLVSLKTKGFASQPNGLPVYHAGHGLPISAMIDGVCGCRDHGGAQYQVVSSF